MRAFLVSAVTATAILIAAFTVLPALVLALPESISFAISNVVRSLLLGIIVGAIFFAAIKRFGFPSSNELFPTVHKKLSAIIAHVTFSFALVLYPFTTEVAKEMGVLGASLVEAIAMASIIGAIAFWITTLDSHTINLFDGPSKGRSKHFKRKLFLGAIFASICIAGVPVLASINQKLFLHRDDGATEILNASARQQMLSQSIGRIAFSSSQTDRLLLKQTIDQAQEQSQLLDTIVSRYIAIHDVDTETQNLLPGNSTLLNLQSKYIADAKAVLDGQLLSNQNSNLDTLQASIDNFLLATESSIKTFQQIDHEMHETKVLSQAVRVLLSPFVIIGLSFGLFWPLLRLVNAQQYGLVMRRQEAESAVVAKDQFVATVSHELRTPMNGILGMLTLLLKSNLEDKQRKQATIALNSGNDLLTILNDILDSSKAERGHIQLENIPFETETVINSVRDLLSGQARNKQIDLSYSPHGVIPESIICDPTRFRQILMNLIGNAIKFTDTGGVTINARFQGDENRGTLKIEVKDTGIGIAKDARDRIFDPFSQADDSITRKFGGTGLGLSITRQLVELMGGTIGVNSVDGAGSTFWFELPVTVSTSSRMNSSDEYASSAPAETEFMPRKAS